MLRNLQLYEQLLQFPLFQGMSSGELQHIIAHTKFDFRKYNAGSTVYREGTPCTHMHFLIHGRTEITTVSNDRNLAVTEEQTAPYMSPPERLFGINQLQGNTMRAITDINLILISKNEINAIAENFLVFRINIINTMAYKAQKLHNRKWHPQPVQLRQRIIRYITDHCERPAGRKEIHIIMNYLARELNDSRLDVSKALNDMQDNGLLQLQRGRIIIPALEKLI